MERLTERSANSNMVWFKDCENDNARLEPCEMNAHHNRMVIEKLSTYEDLEEQGKLIKIPLEAYCIVDSEVRKGFVVGFVVEETYNIRRKPLLVVRYDDNSLKSHRGYLGISVFLTQSEAEEKLKELRGGGNGSME